MAFSVFGCWVGVYLLVGASVVVVVGVSQAGVGGQEGVEGYSTDLPSWVGCVFLLEVHLKCNQPLQLVQSADLQRPSLVIH